MDMRFPLISGWLFDVDFMASTDNGYCDQLNSLGFERVAGTKATTYIAKLVVHRFSPYIVLKPILLSAPLLYKCALGGQNMVFI